MKRLGMLLVFAVICAALGGGYWWYTQKAAPGDQIAGQAKGKGKGKGKGRGGPLVVKAAKAVTKPMPVLIEAVGTVEPEHSVQVRAQVGGLLQTIGFKEGDRVKQGQLLFQLDARTLKAQYNQSVAALARDRAQLENARAQQQRLQPLLKREFITQQEYDVAVTSVRSLEATVQAGQAAVEQARIQLEYTQIHAPISGRTGALAIRPGNLVNTTAGGVPLVTINSMDPILVAFSIPERQLEELRRHEQDREMRIDILPDRSGPVAATGRLVFIDNTVTSQTGTVLLKTRVVNSREVIWPGQFVNVRVVLTIEPEAIVVPELAVQPGQQGSFVYLIDADSKVQVRPVTVSRQIGDEVVIASGIRAGDQVITEIPQALHEGATVRMAGTEGEPRKGKGKGKGKKKKSEDENAARSGGEAGSSGNTGKTEAGDRKKGEVKVDAKS